jgi:hypothetical protein
MYMSRTGAGGNNGNVGGNVKLGKPRFQMSGPLADMVQERLRQRNEL